LQLLPVRGCELFCVFFLEFDARRLPSEHRLVSGGKCRKAKKIGATAFSQR
jgi:hypothetical protein